MKSRLLNRLDADIRSAADPLTADCFRCERAAYLARLGDGGEAANELSHVQRRHAAQPNARISAWVHFAEALVGFFSHQAPQSHDKMKRAHALSAAVGHKPLQALSAAWLAHFDYGASRPAAMASHAAQALALAEPDHHAARARACLVVAQSYHDGGRFDQARPWYDDAHRHATAEGDDTTLSGIMWNMTSLRVTALQQAEACGPAQANGGDHARASAESTARFDAMLGMNSLSELSPVLHAQLFTALGQTAEALPLYEAHFDAAMAQGFGGIEGSLRADRAWCRLQAGQRQAARDDAERADQHLLQRPGGWSDRAIGHSRLAQVYGALGDDTAAQRQAELAAGAWEGYRALQVELVDALDREFSGRAS